MSFAEEVVASGEDCNYLNHATFCQNRHDDKVREIFDEKVEGYSCPASRLTRAHTFDFNLSFRGARLIDGECKDTASKADEGVLVFHSADQFGYKDSSLSMLTTSTGIKFFKYCKDSGAGAMKTIFYETRKYKLGPITQSSFMQDQHAGDDDLQLPPKFCFCRNGKIFEFHERDRECLQDWSDLRSECKWFMLVAMQAIDVICSEVMKMDVKQVIGKSIRNYHAGWGKASFLSIGILQLKSNRPITDTWRFMYSRQNMEGLDYKNDYLKLHVKLLKIYQEVLNSNIDITDDFWRMAQENLVRHKDKIEEARMEEGSDT